MKSDPNEANSQNTQEAVGTIIKVTNVESNNKIDSDTTVTQVTLPQTPRIESCVNSIAESPSECTSLADVSSIARVMILGTPGSGTSAFMTALRASHLAISEEERLRTLFMLRLQYVVAFYHLLNRMELGSETKSDDGIESKFGEDALSSAKWLLKLFCQVSKCNVSEALTDTPLGANRLLSTSIANHLGASHSKDIELPFVSDLMKQPTIVSSSMLGMPKTHFFEINPRVRQPEELISQFIGVVDEYASRKHCHEHSVFESLPLAISSPRSKGKLYDLLLLSPYPHLSGITHQQQFMLLQFKNAYSNELMLDSTPPESGCENFVSPITIWSKLYDQSESLINSIYSRDSQTNYKAPSSSPSTECRGSQSSITSPSYRIQSPSSIGRAHKYTIAPPPPEFIPPPPEPSTHLQLDDDKDIFLSGAVEDQGGSEVNDDDVSSMRSRRSTQSQNRVQAPKWVQAAAAQYHREGQDLHHQEDFVSSAKRNQPYIIDIDGNHDTKSQDPLSGSSSSVQLRPASPTNSLISFVSALSHLSSHSMMTNHNTHGQGGLVRSPHNYLGVENDDDGLHDSHFTMSISPQNRTTKGNAQPQMVVSPREVPNSADNPELKPFLVAAPPPDVRYMRATSLNEVSGSTPSTTKYGNSQHQGSDEMQSGSLDSNETTLQKTDSMCKDAQLFLSPKNQTKSALENNETSQPQKDGSNAMSAELIEHLKKVWQDPVVHRFWAKAVDTTNHLLTNEKDELANLKIENNSASPSIKELLSSMPIMMAEIDLVSRPEFVPRDVDLIRLSLNSHAVLSTFDRQQVVPRIWGVPNLPGIAYCASISNPDLADNEDFADSTPLETTGNEESVQLSKPKITRSVPDWFPPSLKNSKSPSQLNLEHYFPWNISKLSDTNVEQTTSADATQHVSPCTSQRSPSKSTEHETPISTIGPLIRDFLIQAERPRAETCTDRIVMKADTKSLQIGIENSKAVNPERRPEIDFAPTELTTSASNVTSSAFRPSLSAQTEPKQQPKASILSQPAQSFSLKASPSSVIPRSHSALHHSFETSNSVSVETNMNSIGCLDMRSEARTLVMSTSASGIESDPLLQSSSFGSAPCVVDQGGRRRDLLHGSSSALTFKSKSNIGLMTLGELTADVENADELGLDTSHDAPNVSNSVDNESRLKSVEHNVSLGTYTETGNFNEVQGVDVSTRIDHSANLLPAPISRMGKSILSGGKINVQGFSKGRDFVSVISTPKQQPQKIGKVEPESFQLDAPVTHNNSPIASEEASCTSLKSAVQSLAIVDSPQPLGLLFIELPEVFGSSLDGILTPPSPSIVTIDTPSTPSSPYFTSATQEEPVSPGAKALAKLKLQRPELCRGSSYDIAQKTKKVAERGDRHLQNTSPHDMSSKPLNFYPKDAWFFVDCTVFLPKLCDIEPKVFGYDLDLSKPVEYIDDSKADRLLNSILSFDSSVSELSKLSMELPALSAFHRLCSNVALLPIRVKLVFSNLCAARLILSCICTILLSRREKKTISPKLSGIDGESTKLGNADSKPETCYESVNFLDEHDIECVVLSLLIRFVQNLKFKFKSIYNERIENGPQSRKLEFACIGTFSDPRDVNAALLRLLN